MNFDPSSIRRPSPVFPGIDKPSIDFQPIRDQRRALPDHFDVDLSVARSFAAGTALILPAVSGNVFYIDQDPINTGTATVYFQDTTKTATPVTCRSGSIFKIPFTGLAFENTAQAGKRLRVLYGVDIDFQPSMSADVNISGGVGINQGPAPFYDDAAVLFNSGAALGIGGVATVINPASNTNGVILWSYEEFFFINVNGAHPTASLLAKATAPTTSLDGMILSAARNQSLTSTSGSPCTVSLKRPLKIAAGLGVYFFNGTNAQAYAARTCAYSLL